MWVQSPHSQIIICIVTLLFHSQTTPWENKSDFVTLITVWISLVDEPEIAEINPLQVSYKSPKATVSLYCDKTEYDVSEMVSGICSPLCRHKQSCITWLDLPRRLTFFVDYIGGQVMDIRHIHLNLQTVMASRPSPYHRHNPKPTSLPNPETNFSFRIRSGKSLNSIYSRFLRRISNAIG